MSLIACRHIAKLTGLNPLQALKELRPSCQLLCDHSGRSDHGKAAVVKLFGLHYLQFLRILGLQAKGIETKVSGDAIVPHRPRPIRKLLVVRSHVVEGLLRENLWDGDCRHNCRPEVLQRRLLESDVGWHVDVATKERMELLAHKYAQRCEHRNTAVLQLDFAVKEKFALFAIGGE